MQPQPDSPSEIPRPYIRRLWIKNFRGLKDFEWFPSQNLNILIGGGDTGKSTILDAISLLFAATNYRRLSDIDFFGRTTNEAIYVEADVHIPADYFSQSSRAHMWPWAWSKQGAVPPTLEGNHSEPVYKVALEVNADFELEYSVIQPNEERTSFSLALRRNIGIVDLTQIDNHNRDLRLVSGSQLERLFDSAKIRSASARASGEALEQDEDIQELTKDPLSKLGNEFIARGLPGGLTLGLVSPPTSSLTSLIGLMATTEEEVSLPVSSWGTGTRNIAVLTLGNFGGRRGAISVVDEIERGLEPYRQRRLIHMLGEQDAQMFITTHSEKILQAMPESSTIWNVYREGRSTKIGEITRSVRTALAENFEALFAKVPIFVEGSTEVGFVKQLLKQELGVDLLDFGIHIADGKGNDNCIKLLTGLNRAGVRAAGFIDDEDGKNSGKVRELKESYQDLLFQWPSGCTEENVISHIPESELKNLICKCASQPKGQRLAALHKRLGADAKDFDALVEKAGSLSNLRQEIIRSALEQPNGNQPAEKGESKNWFKSVEGGTELAAKTKSLGAWEKGLNDIVEPFISAVSGAAGIARDDKNG